MVKIISFKKMNVIYLLVICQRLYLVLNFFQSSLQFKPRCSSKWFDSQHFKNLIPQNSNLKLTKLYLWCLYIVLGSHPAYYCYYSLLTIISHYAWHEPYKIPSLLLLDFILLALYRVFLLLLIHYVLLKTLCFCFVQIAYVSDLMALCYCYFYNACSSHFREICLIIFSLYLVLIYFAEYVFAISHCMMCAPCIVQLLPFLHVAQT